MTGDLFDALAGDDKGVELFRRATLGRRVQRTAQLVAQRHSRCRVSGQQVLEIGLAQLPHLHLVTGAGIKGALLAQQDCHFAQDLSGPELPHHHAVALH